MSNIISFLLSALLLYKYWARLVVFFCSGLILPIPTSTVLLAAGAFASQGYFNFFISLTVVVGANVVGDYMGYMLARRYGHKALDMIHVNIPVWFTKLEDFLHNHPRSAIFITRFTGATDVATNVTCGFSGVPATTFLIFDTLGNIVSNGSLLYAGYFLGAHWQDFSGIFNISDYIILGIIVTVVLFIIIWKRRQTDKDKL